jgi:hypothetical protein
MELWNRRDLLIYFVVMSETIMSHRSVIKDNMLI